MKGFLDLSVRAKLYLGFGVMVLLLAGTAFAAYRGITSIRDSQRALFEVQFADAVDISRLVGDMNANRADILEMLSFRSRSEQDRMRQQISENAQAIMGTFQQLLDRSRSDPQLLARLEEQGDRLPPAG